MQEKQIISITTSRCKNITKMNIQATKLYNTLHETYLRK